MLSTLLIRGYLKVNHVSEEAFVPSGLKLLYAAFLGAVQQCQSLSGVEMVRAVEHHNSLFLHTFLMFSFLMY